MFRYIKINDFRLLKGQEFKIGSYVTMFAGWNASGKSTVLALLANSTQSAEINPFTGRAFSAEFSEILKGSSRFDETKSDRLEIGVERDGNWIVKNFRTTWQNGGNRFRVIPKGIGIDGKKTESKFDIPVVYLGLSRLYPLGEVEEKRATNSVLDFRDNTEKEWFKENHTKILSYADTITDIEKIDINSSRKKGCCVGTQNYDWRSNSSGQDNLGQILMGVLALKKYCNKENNKTGLLIIDEVEASLHPRAQEKLIEFLIKEAKKNRIQIVFTTHSLTCIESFLVKSTKDASGNLCSYYFTRPNGPLEVWHNPEIKRVKNDILVEKYERPSKKQKVKIYSEDPEALWFVKKIMKGHCNKFKFINVSISCNILIELMNVDDAFQNSIIVFDGDVTLEKLKKIKKAKQNYLLLPTNNGKLEPMEWTFRDFLHSNSADKYYANERERFDCVNRRYFDEYDITNEKQKNRENAKIWFNMHKKLFDDSNLYKYWAAEHIDAIKRFQKKLLEIHSKLSANQ